MQISCNFFLFLFQFSVKAKNQNYVKLVFYISSELM